ncbi:MAG: hypothetical protein MO846_08090 [Candidatus Devosia symbiotica]|nr:hypothetical protein [Candidatus Devosia symbiotica]
MQIFLPEQAVPYWNCHYAIDWPDAPIESFADGNDAIAALHTAIKK